MKKNIVYSIVAAMTVAVIALSVGTTGCKTVPGGGTTFDLPTAARNLQAAAEFGSYYAMQKDPKTRPIFVAVVAGLDLAISNNTVTAAQLQAAVLPLVGTNIDARAAVMASIGIYEINFGDAVSAGIASNKVAAALVPALDNGFKAALAAPAGQQTYTSKR
jgi:predicted small secreted protein